MASRHALGALPLALLLVGSSTLAAAGAATRRQSGGVVENEYIRRVDRVGGELQNTVIATLPQRVAVLDVRPQDVL